MRHDVPHNLDDATAKLVADKSLDSYRRQFSEYQPRLTWPSSTRAEIAFKIKGVTLTGSVDLLPGVFAIDMEVPFVFRLFKKKATAVVEREIRKWIAKAERGELSDTVA